MLHGTWESIHHFELIFRLQDFHFLRLSLPRHSTKLTKITRHLHSSTDTSRFHRLATHASLHKAIFIAVPFSLTTTRGITFVFFSWRYLDVSVHAVGSLALYIQARMFSI